MNKPIKYTDICKIFLSSFVFLLFVFKISLATTVIINSKDWSDVYSGILFSRFKGYEVYFMNSPSAQWIFTTIPTTEKIKIIESSNPFTTNLDALLKSKGYVDVENIKINDATVDLYEKLTNINGFYIVEKDDPYAAISIGPLSQIDRFWVFIVDDKNVKKVASIISKENKKVVLVGFFRNSIKNSLRNYASEEITGKSKFELSKTIAEKFLKEKNVHSIVFTDGKYLVKEFFPSGKTQVSQPVPILIFGTNLLPKGTVEWLESHEIRTCIFYDPRLFYLGAQIRQKSKEMGKPITVITAYMGVAQPGRWSGEVYALPMFPLPVGNVSLNVTDVFYDPAEKAIFITFHNYGKTGLFELTSFKVLNNGKEIASGSDRNPIFIGAGEFLTIKYENITIPAEYFNNSIVEFYTSYGEFPQSMDNYLTNERRFGPPLTRPLKVKEIRDESKIEIGDVTYYKFYKRIGVEIINVGKKPTYLMIKFPSIVVDGIPKHFHSRIYYMSGDKKVFYVPIQLSDVDIQDNENIEVIVDYGERKDFLVKSVQGIYNLKVKSLSTTYLALYIGIGATAIVLGLLIIVRKLRYKKKKRRRKKKR